MIINLNNENGLFYLDRLVPCFFYGTVLNSLAEDDYSFSEFHPGKQKTTQNHETFISQTNVIKIFPP